MAKYFNTAKCSLTTCAGKTCQARRNAFITESPTTWYARRHANATEKRTTCMARSFFCRVGLFTRAQTIIAPHCVQLGIFNPYSKMESKSEVNDIISTNRKRKHNSSDGDSEFDGIVFSPLRNRRIILSDDEEECINEDCERNIIFNEWVWRDNENIPKIWKYSRISKINIPFGQSVTVLQMVIEILTEDFWQIIVTETNRYASQILRNDTHKLKKYEDNWRDTNVDEMKAYFALCILMSQVKKNNIQSYWSKRGIIETPIFRKTMPFWRFAQLSRFLHFTNNDVEDNNNDRLWKLRSVIDYFNEKFQSIYTPEEDVSLDESLMKYTGRMAYKQYNPSKRARFGVKFYKLCESKSGYCIQFKIYTGQDRNKNADTSASESVTMFMCTPISGYGHTLFLDNWYSSPSLFAKLQSIKTNAIGTVRCNRKNMPKELAAAKLKQSDVISRSSNGILVAKWKDKKDIYIMSTKHLKIEMTKVEKKRWKNNKQRHCNKTQYRFGVQSWHGWGGFTR